MIKTNHAIIAMVTIIDNHPEIADGMNEKGFGCADLNFDGYAYFKENTIDGNKNIVPYYFKFSKYLCLEFNANYKNHIDITINVVFIIIK